jgi:hypothetical protein
MATVTAGQQWGGIGKWIHAVIEPKEKYERLKKRRLKQFDSFDEFCWQQRGRFDRTSHAIVRRIREERIARANEGSIEFEHKRSIKETNQ